MMKKNNKKNIALLLLLMMLINFGGQSIVSAAATTPPPLVTGSSSNIKFTVTADQTTYVKDGGYWDINVSIRNTSQSYRPPVTDEKGNPYTDSNGNIVERMPEQNDAYSVTAKATIANPDKVYIDGSGILFPTQDILINQSAQGRIQLKTSADAESATVPVTISIDYYDNSNKLQTTTETIYVRLDAPEKPSNPIYRN